MGQLEKKLGDLKGLLKTEQSKQPEHAPKSAEVRAIEKELLKRKTELLDLKLAASWQNRDLMVLRMR